MPSKSVHASLGEPSDPQKKESSGQSLQEFLNQLSGNDKRLYWKWQKNLHSEIETIYSLVCKLVKCIGRKQSVLTGSILASSSLVTWKLTRTLDQVAKDAVWSDLGPPCPFTLFTLNRSPSSGSWPWLPGESWGPVRIQRERGLWSAVMPLEPGHLLTLQVSIISRTFKKNINIKAPVLEHLMQSRWGESGHQHL
jgi:hypothetical protein